MIHHLHTLWRKVSLNLSLCHRCRLTDGYDKMSYRDKTVLLTRYIEGVSAVCEL